MDLIFLYPVKDFDLIDVRDLFKLSVVCVSAGGVGEGAAVLHKMYINYGVTQARGWRAMARQQAKDSHGHSGYDTK